MYVLAFLKLATNNVVEYHLVLQDTCSTKDIPTNAQSLYHLNITITAAGISCYVYPVRVPVLVGCGRSLGLARTRGCV